MSTTNDLSRTADAPSQMLGLLNACFTTRALHVVAALGIADHLTDQAMSPDDLAVVTGAHGPSLHRLLRVLAGVGVFGVGVFREDTDGRFALTPLGATLRSEGSDSVRDWAVYIGARAPWEAWGQLRETMPTYEYLARNPELGVPFDRWMTQQPEQHNAALVAAYDFSSFRTEAEFRDLFAAAGLRLARIIPTASPNCILEGLPA